MKSIQDYFKQEAIHNKNNDNKNNDKDNDKDNKDNKNNDKDNIIKKNKIYVYTDGACSKNGSKNAKAGLGIYFGINDSRNTYRPIYGKQTNNTAELTAIIVACNILKNEIIENIPIYIVSDSKYSILCCTSYGTKSYLSNWKITSGKKKGEYIPNKDLVKQAYEISKIPNIHFIKIEAHTGKQDIHSLGNKEADRLANLAIGRIVNNKTDKIYLKVPFDKKDMIKELGGKWDFKKKKWYIIGDEHLSKINNIIDN